MPAYVEDPNDTFDYQTDFLEVIDTQAPGSVHLSNDVQEATLVGYVRANKLRSCARWFLGYAEADVSAPWRLRRENPQYHPDFPQLRAYDVSAVKMLPQGNSAEGDAVKVESPFATGLFTGYYQWMVVTVRYRNFLYRFREDSEITSTADEWKRHTFVQTEPRLEALSATGGMSQLRFAETSATGPTTGATGAQFGAPLLVLLSKKGIIINWYDVAWEYLSENDDVFEPLKLDRIAGKLNSETFLGYYPAGTLLAEPYRYTVSTWAVAPDDANDPLRKVTLAIPFSFFDPEKGATSSIYRGHNLMPWGGTGVDSGTVKAGGDGKFYMATRSGTLTGNLTTELGLLKYADFRDIFTHVSEP